MFQSEYIVEGLRDGRLALTFPNGSQSRLRLEIRSRKRIEPKQFLVSVNADAETFAALNPRWAKSESLQSSYTYVQEVPQGGRKESKSFLCTGEFRVELRPWRSVDAARAVKEYIAAVYLVKESNTIEIIERVW